MGRHSTIPDYFDLVPQIKLSKFKEWGYLKSGSLDFNITWTANWGFHGTSSIRVYLDIIGENGLMTLSYSNKGESVRQDVELVSIESNLGFGLVWYFVCPFTNKRCRKLYGIGKPFAHRTYFKRGLYIQQSSSNNYKRKFTLHTKFKRKEKAYDLIYSKNFKQYYEGKPTKRFLMALRWIEEAKGIREEDFLI